MKKAFAPASDFEDSADNDSVVLPFRFRRLASGKIFVSGDSGEYALLSPDEFRTLTAGAVGGDSQLAHRLSSRLLVEKRTGAPALRMQARGLRSRRLSFGAAPQLHIVVVTLRCEHTCVYCQVSRRSEDSERFDLSKADAELACDVILSSPADPLKVEFQGGEPLLAFETIRNMVQRLTSDPARGKRHIDFVVATNLSLVSSEHLQFFREHGVHLSTSLDGPPGIHDTNRIRATGSSYEAFMSGLTRARSELGHDRVAALVTVTRPTLAEPLALIREYESLGFREIFLRPMSPYGFAVRAFGKFGYSTDEFMRFYARALEEVIEVNRRGGQLIECHAQLLLRRLLTTHPSGFVDLQSPAGAGGSCLLYNYDGWVYPSDEARMLAEMGDTLLRLGHVRDSTRQELQLSGPASRIRTNSILEVMPGCSDCAYLPYCGSDPVLNRREAGSLQGFRPTSEFCERQIRMLDLLVNYVEGEDQFARRLLTSWAYR